MHRYVQTVPPPADPYAGDPLLRSWLQRHLGADGHAAAKDRLAGLADEVVGPRAGAPARTEAQGGSGFLTASVVDPFGNILGVMYNPHYVEILRARG